MDCVCGKLRVALVGVLVVIGLAAAMDARADKLELTSGRTLKGAIVGETAYELVIVTDIGRLRIKRSEVRSLERDFTVPEEVEGDTAFAARNYSSALRSYRAALKRVPADSVGATRLNGKLSQLQRLYQHQSDSAMVGQMQQVRQMLASRDYDGAMTTLQSLIPRMPANDESTSAARRLLAETHYAKSKIAKDAVNEIEVVRQLRAAIEVYEPFYLAHLTYGEMLLRSASTEKQGIEEIVKGLRFGENELTEEERLKYHYLLARREFDKGNFESAATHFVECLRSKRTYSAYSDALEYAVKSYIKMGEQSILSDFQKTINNLNEALRLNPENKDAHFLLGRIYKDTGQTQKAVEELKEVVRLDASYESAHYILAQAYMDLHDYDHALEQLQAELKINPTNYDAIVDKADIQIKRAEYDKASKDLDEAARVEPGRYRAYLLLAALAYHQEQYERAQENLGKVLMINMDSIEARIQMGKVLQAQKKYEDARKWFQQVVDHLSKARNLSFKYRNLMAEAETALGEMDLQQDNPRQAETRFRLALEFMPSFAPAFCMIGDVQRRLGGASPVAEEKKARFREAEEYYAKAIDANPEVPEFYLSLGILYHKNLKKLDRAVVNYRKYLETGGRDRGTVNKWIEECGGTPVAMNDAPTTGSAGAAETSSTQNLAGETSATASAASETSATQAASGETSATRASTDPTSATQAGASETTSTQTKAGSTTESAAKAESRS